MTISRTLLCVLLGCFLLLTHPVQASEVESPERFLRSQYGWTIKGLDAERGFFGDFRSFACFDDRIGPPTTQDGKNRFRWGTQCQTKRSGREDLGAMIFVSWVNPAHAKPVTAGEVFLSAARMMAGNESNQAYDAKCGDPEKLNRAGRDVLIHDCSMILPFGTYFASFVQFSHRDVEYFVRVQNASSRPIPEVPNKTARKVVAGLEFD